MNNVDLQKTCDEFYNRFVLDESIIGFETLFRDFGIKSGRLKNKIRNVIYLKYGREKLIEMYRKRLAKCGGIAFSKSNVKWTNEDIEKRRNGLRKYWENNSVRKEQGKELIKRFCLPKAHTETINRKRVKSRKHGGGWKPHSVETKSKLSSVFKKKWENGDYDNRRPTICSRGQIEMCRNLKEMGYNVMPEFRVVNKPFDAGIPDLKLLFEFNGTYWHLDPIIFEAHYFDRFRSIYAYQIWKKDALKRQIAEKMGYRVITIWQADWDEAYDKQFYLKEVINERNSAKTERRSV